MPPKIKRVGKYILGRTLGQGTFGKVKVALDTETDKHVAIKMMDKSKIREARMGAQIKKEIRVMKMLDHPTCIKLYEVLASKTTIFMVLELVTGGELFDRIVEKGRYDEKTGRNYFKQLIAGLEHCHSLGICHRDLKPENLLLDDAGGLKISDFGLSSLAENRDEKVLLHTACGTPNYVAPEVLMEKGYDGEAADIWSAGVILYVLLAGFLPFDEAQMYDLFRKIISADFQYPAWMSREAQDLIASMLEPDADRRATIADIKKSAFYRGVTLEEDESIHRKNSTFFDYIAVAELEAAAALAQARLDSTADQAASNLAKKWKGHRTIADLEEISQPSKSNGNSGENAQSPGMERSTSAAHGDSVSGVSTAISGMHSLDTGSPEHAIAGSPQGSYGTTPNTPGTIVNDGISPEGSESSEPQHAPRLLNAFDLINMVSGQSMNNMLLFNKNSTENASSTQDAGGPVINVSQPPTFTQFTSRKPIKELMQRLDYVLLETPRLKYKIFHRRCQVNLVWVSPKNHIVGCHIEIFTLTQDLHMVQCKRVTGPILAHHEFFKKLRDDVKQCEETVPLADVRKKLEEWHLEHQNTKQAPASQTSASESGTEGAASTIQNGIAVGLPVALTYDTVEDFAADARVRVDRLHPEESKGPTPASPHVKSKYHDMPDTYISLKSARSAEAAELAIAATEAAKAAYANGSDQTSNSTCSTNSTRVGSIALPGPISFTNSSPAGFTFSKSSESGETLESQDRVVPLTPAHLAIKALRSAAAEAGACSPAAGPVRAMTFAGDAEITSPVHLHSPPTNTTGTISAPTTRPLSTAAAATTTHDVHTSLANFSMRNADRMDTESEGSTTSDDDDRSVASEISVATTNATAIATSHVPPFTTDHHPHSSSNRLNVKSFTPSTRVVPAILSNPQSSTSAPMGAAATSDPVPPGVTTRVNGAQSSSEQLKVRPSKSTAH